MTRHTRSERVNSRRSLTGLKRDGFSTARVAIALIGSEGAAVERSKPAFRVSVVERVALGDSLEGVVGLGSNVWTAASFKDPGKAAIRGKLR